MNQFIPYQHFNMDGLHCLRNILMKGDCMCKLDLKDVYFSVPLNPLHPENLCSFFGQGNITSFFPFDLY